MSKLPHVVPITELRKDSATVLDNLRGSEQPTIVTQHGRAAAILMSVDAYERGEREREILRALARGEKEIAEDKGVSLDQVLADADDLLASK